MLLCRRRFAPATRAQTPRNHTLACGPSRPGRELRSGRVHGTKCYLVLHGRLDYDDPERVDRGCRRLGAPGDGCYGTARAQGAGLPERSLRSLSKRAGCAQTCVPYSKTTGGTAKTLIRPLNLLDHLPLGVLEALMFKHYLVRMPFVYLHIRTDSPQPPFGALCSSTAGARRSLALTKANTCSPIHSRTRLPLCGASGASSAVSSSRAARLRSRRCRATAGACHRIRAALRSPSGAST
jgi:hypothetical protein